MKTILIAATTEERYNFFKKLVPQLKILNFNFLFLTNNLKVYFDAKNNGFEVYLIWKKYRKNQETYSDITKSIFLAAGKLSEKENREFYLSTYNLLEKIYNNKKFDACFMGGGWLTAELAIRDFAQNHNIKTLYFELANIPGKIVADPEGSNAAARLYKHPEILEGFEATEDEYNEWKRKYLEVKLSNFVLPQAKKRNQTTRLMNVLMFFTNKLIGITYDAWPDLRIRNWIKGKDTLKYDKIDNYESLDYMFFPLQVSSDTQTVFNSDLTIPGALSKAINLAREKGLKLIVKPHPAEDNKALVKKLYDLKEKEGFYFVNENTIKLIQKAKEVVTINSTVGLEAQIMDKPVTYLGRSFYAKFDEKYLRNYILKFTIEADYFNDEPVKIESVREMLSRCGLLKNPFFAL